MLIVHSGTVLTMNDTMDMVSGPVVIDDGRILQVGGDVAAPAGTREIDASGCLVLPGLIQTHVHLCQTLFRGGADDLPLLAWLRQRVWPLEAAHDEASLRASTRLAAAELLRSGTTSVLTMETVHDTEVVLDALADTGIRATVGKCLMDQGDGAPPRLLEADPDRCRLIPMRPQARCLNLSVSAGIVAYEVRRQLVAAGSMPVEPTV